MWLLQLDRVRFFFVSCLLSISCSTPRDQNAHVTPAGVGSGGSPSTDNVVPTSLESGGAPGAGANGVETATAGSTASNDGATNAGTANAGAAGTAWRGAVPASYLGKVKNVLVGLAPTDDEVSSVTTDPNQLKVLIAQWMQLPQYQGKLQRFFELAFQQSQISEPDFADQFYPQRLVLNASVTPLLVQNAEQSFARTMLELVRQGRPLTDALVTSQFMLTTTLREIYAFLDVWEVDNDGKVSDRFKRANPNLSIYAQAAAGPIAITESINSASPNFMHFYDPDVTAAGAVVAGCDTDPIVYPSNGMTLHQLLYGSLEGWKNAAGVACPQFGGTAAAPQFTSDDFSDWKLVTIRAPQSGEATTAFYDLPALRHATELVLSTPRVGFFSTPAYFANWQTNTSNQMRVTLNQALIVALGAQVDGTDDTPAPGDPVPGFDVTHAGSAECAACHQTLDPLRSISSANYSWNYHNQLDTKWVT